MPIYEYECTKCGKIEEVLQNFTDKPLTKCRICGGKLHKLVSHSTFHLKGTGWYVTDYAKKSANTSSNNRKGNSADTASSDTGSQSKKKSGDSSS